jgi:hypothetical protein
VRDEKKITIEPQQHLPDLIHRVDGRPFADEKGHSFSMLVDCSAKKRGRSSLKTALSCESLRDEKDDWHNLPCLPRSWPHRFQ